MTMILRKAFVARSRAIVVPAGAAKDQIPRVLYITSDDHIEPHVMQISSH